MFLVMTLPPPHPLEYISSVWNAVLLYLGPVHIYPDIFIRFSPPSTPTVSAVVGNENAGFWKRLPEWRFLKMPAYKEVLEYDDAMHN